MFRIKICGVTTATDAGSAAAAGADAIGLNFFAGSRRYLPPDAAEEVAAAIPSGVLKVGVFVNASAELVRQTADRLRLDLVQLAGDETPDLMRELDGWPLMKVLRPRLEEPNDFDRSVLGFLRETDRLGCTPKMILIDAHHPGEFGGTGRTVNWSLLSQSWNDLRRTFPVSGEALAAGCLTPPLVLAGGLNHENVRQAIAAVRPLAIDVASGVESSPGVKDPQRMRHFIAAAIAGFESVAPPAGSPPPSRPTA